MFLLMQTPPVVPDTITINWLTTLGVGGALAAFMFLLYRRDIKQYTDLWKSATDQLIVIVKENTASNVELIALIENKLNGGDSEVKQLKETIKSQSEKIDRLEGQIKHIRPGGATR